MKVGLENNPGLSYAVLGQLTPDDPLSTPDLDPDDLAPLAHGHVLLGMAHATRLNIFPNVTVPTVMAQWAEHISGMHESCASVLLPSPQIEPFIRGMNLYQVLGELGNAPDKARPAPYYVELTKDGPFAQCMIATGASLVDLVDAILYLPVDNTW